ncbi:hypothetical protein [Streptomyces triticiradicis]|uniref:Uncharacterized protein n=1 Tax=Streptomyces triticiradicis TaxID=2651189 RepID=A0A7J5D2Q0_9ACTN|nr:hypothetical protein [Streptomyces triticiradicis]KAB1977844.1 hypothetical protein F8144_40835 [Streptomyces triticiradicis]
MRELLTLADLSVPMRALRTLAVEYGDLPVPHVLFSPFFPERLDLSLHNGLGDFEVWRAALDIDPGQVELREQTGGTWVLGGTAPYAGAEIRLIAYGPTLDSVRADAEGGGDA